MITTNLKPHSLAELFPAMSDEEFKALTADIQANGLRVPIVLYAGQILDGRHRHRAATEAKLTLTEKDFVEFRDGDPIKFVVSQNVHRRHLNESQRAIIAGELANGKHGGDRSKGSNDPLTEDKVAALLNVSEASVKRGKKVLTGNPALANAVRKGDIKVSAAQKFAESNRQDELLKKHEGDIVKAVKALNENTDTPTTALWNAMKSKFEKMELADLETTVKVLSDNLATYLKAKQDLAETERRAA
jgi:ParB-like chromosome segregation protein Spo0J